jgi:hypothetical protein
MDSNTIKLREVPKAKKYDLLFERFEGNNRVMAKTKTTLKFTKRMVNVKIFLDRWIIRSQAPKRCKTHGEGSETKW